MVSVVDDLGNIHCEGLFNNREEVEDYLVDAKELELDHEIKGYKLYQLVEA
ncbi:hypothetical protein [Dendrosporobacter sp. 1207_IL3150]|uniref:hypothetical protein n=1 Tax=Dendrosporobacter sp. 1207_IL3150 TaxID=3084054 RepID=UPI002FDA4D2E